MFHCLIAYYTPDDDSELEVLENSSLASEVVDKDGAYTLARLTGRSFAFKKRVRSRSGSLLPGSTIVGRLFLTAQSSSFTIRICSLSLLVCQCSQVLFL